MPKTNQLDIETYGCYKEKDTQQFIQKHYVKRPRDIGGGCKKNLDHFSIYACHPCAGAMLIFSVSFQFYRMSPKGR